MSHHQDEMRLKVGLDLVQKKVADIRDQLYGFQADLNRGASYQWPEMLDRFGVLQVAIRNLFNQLCDKRVPALHDRLFAPVMISTQRDEHLEAISQGRIREFNHEVVPQLLRTKCIPEIEAMEVELQAQPITRASPEDLQKRIESLQAVCHEVLGALTRKQKEWEELKPVAPPRAETQRLAALLARESRGFPPPKTAS